MLRAVGCLLFLLYALGLNGQELKCVVDVNSSKIEGSSQQIFNTLQRSVEEFMNTTAFTQKSYKDFEKIDCRLLIDVESYNNDNFLARVLVQSTRPVYNSNYLSPMLNFVDNEVQFSYIEYEPIEYHGVNVMSELEALLSFYAHIIIGLDQDSFALNGGDESFRKARNIAMQMQNSTDQGWRFQSDNRGRTAMLECFTNALSTPFRELIYHYHRNGLDIMSRSIDKGRNVVSNFLIQNLERIYSLSPFSFSLTVFHDSKLNELLQIFSSAPIQEKTVIKKTLNEVYPADHNLIEAL